MAYDIGPKIGIEGESEFRKSLKQVSENIKTLGSEMKVVTSSFEGNEKSIESLTAQNEVLAKQIGAVEDKIKLQADAVAKASEKFGKSATETLKWERALNESVAELNNLKNQVSKNEKAMDGLDDAMEDVTKEAKNMDDSFGSLDVAMGNLISGGIQSIVSGLGNAVTSIIGLGESTKEFRDEQAKLQTAFQSTGKSVRSAESTYKKLYSVIGDSGEATEAAQLLANLATTTEDLSNWTEIAAGVTGTFGDALPITSLIEAANETAKVGQVTGALADALNWVGMSEDEFNAKLAELGTTQERTAFITETLSGAYSDAAESFRKNNEQVIKANEAQLELDTSLAKVGGAVDSVKTSLLEAFGPTISKMAEELAKVIGNIDVDALKTAVDGLVASFDTFIPILTGVVSGLVAYKAAVTIGSIIDKVTKATEGMSAAQAALNLVMSANPLALVATLVVGLGTALVALYHTNEDFREGVKKVWETVKTTVTTVVDNIKTKFTELVNWFKNLPDKLKEVGKNIVQGLWNGIQSMSGWIQNKVSGFLNGIVGSVKNVLGIHSPSRVFAGIGENMAAGIGVGFGSEMGSVQRQVNRSVVELVPDVSSAAPASSGAVGATISAADLKSALDGIGVYLSGQKVGSLTTIAQRNNARANGTA